MKKAILLAAVVLMAVAAQAQNYMVVNTEKIFTSIEQYNSIVKSLDEEGKRYQQEIDDAYASLEKTFNNYQAVKERMTAAARQSQEDAILKREKEIAARQKELLGQDGTLVKKRVEQIKPIQDKVFALITKYAQDNKFDLVLDIATNPTILYYKPSADKTNEIIKLYK